MFCKYCGTQVPDGYICGCPDSLRAAQAAAAVPQPAAQEQYDPNAQYAGQYDPNAQYAEQYDPNAQYAGQYDPNAQYDEQYDPNAQYAEQYDPNAQYAGQYDPNAQYGYPQEPVATQQPVAPQRPAGPSFGQQLGQTMKNLPAIFKNMFTDALTADFDLLTSAVFAVGTFVISLLTWLFMFMGLLGEIMDYIDGAYGLAIVTGLLVWLVPTVLTALIPLIGQLIRKENVDIVKCFAQAAGATVMPAAMLFVTSLMMLISSTLGLIFFLFTAVVSVIITGKLAEKHLKSGNGIWNVMAMGAVVAVIALLILWICSAPVIGEVENLLYGAMGFM